MRLEEVEVLAKAAVTEAERCRCEARATVEKEPDRYAALVGQPSGWCVVTEKGFWSRAYHNRYEASRLRDSLGRGHKVVVTVGVVALPDIQLNTTSHVAKVAVSEAHRISEDKLESITVRAKLHAVRGLF